MNNSTSLKNIVLYADDDQDDLQLVRDAFEEYKSVIELRTVNDGVEAISCLKKILDENIVPCLIILDINMPRMNGKEALIRLRQMKQLETVPVILFTTSSSIVDKRFAGEHNASFITKPIDTTQLNSISQKFLDKCNLKMNGKNGQ